jgi:hypothetical protein
MQLNSGYFSAYQDFHLDSSLLITYRQAARVTFWKNDHSLTDAMRVRPPVVLLILYQQLVFQKKSLRTNETNFSERKMKLASHAAHFPLKRMKQ